VIGISGTVVHRLVQELRMLKCIVKELRALAGEDIDFYSKVCCLAVFLMSRYFVPLVPNRCS
jgi:hypothetical protein